MVSRTLLFGLVLLAVAALSNAATSIVIGTESSSLYVADFDASSGALTLRQTLSVGSNPSFLAKTPNSQYVFAASEVDYFNGKSNSGGLLALRVSSGNLTLINSVTSNGGGPCHVSVDRTGKWLLAANYNGGNYGVWEITSTGALGTNPVSFFQDSGKGGQSGRQDAPHAHQILPDRTNAFVVVPDLGTDKWMQYGFDERTGVLTASNPASLSSPSAAGPRHIAFHPTSSYAFGVAELAGTLTSFNVDASRKALTSKQSVTILQSTGDQKAGAEVQVSSDGKFVYASNRPSGKNGTIAQFSVDSSGNLSNIGFADTQGNTPRFFALSPNGDFVLAANQNSNNIVVLRRDRSTGVIGTAVSRLNNVQQPSHILFL